MVKANKLAVAPEPVEEVEEDNAVTIRVGPMHEAFAEFIREVKGIDINAEQVFAVTSSRVAFRKSDGYQVGVKQAKLEAREAAANEKLSRENERKIDAARKAEEKEKLAAEKAELAAQKTAEREQAAAEKAAAKEQAAAEKAAAKEQTAAKAAPVAAASDKKATRAKAKGKSPF